MKRLVHITTVPESLGFISGQPAYMRQQGFETVAISSPGEKLERFGTREQVEVHSLEMPRRITPLKDLLTVVRLARLLHALEPDIVHAHTPKGGLLGMVAARLAGVPTRIYHMRGLPMMTATGWTRTLLRTTERVSCALAHRVLCQSHSLREAALAEGLCAPEHLQVLLSGSNGVDSGGRFNPARLPGDTRARMRGSLGLPQDALVIGFVGRLVRDKGIVELTEAWQQLREKHPTAHLLLVGPVEERDPVPESTLEALRGDPRVKMVGFVEDTPSAYAAMDLLVLPSYREGFPNVPLEAAAMGLPVVATRVAGCVDAVLEGATGQLVPLGDTAALADALAQYLSDADLRLEHGQAGRKRVEREFQRERLWEVLASVYAELTGAAPSTLESAEGADSRAA